MNIMPRRRRELTPFRTQGDDLLNRFMEAFGAPFSGFESRLPEIFRSGGSPPVNVTETESEFCVAAELPGLDEDDIELQVADNRLVISGERKWEEETDDKEVHRVESQYGSFHRSVPLPTGLVTDPESVTATYKKGMLEVRFRKLEPTRPRKIEVRRDESSEPEH
jgi:HSP20 family protein